MPKAQETVLEIDLKALKHNFEYLKSKTQKDTKILAVVKAFAYGSHADIIANYLQGLDVDYFAVAYVSEGVALRNAGIVTPILVLHPQAINFKMLIERCLEPSLYNAKILNEFITVASEEGQTNYPIHIKFNTGLNRLGFEKNDVDDIISKLKGTNSVITKSIFSHLAASEDLSEKEFTSHQIQNFENITKEFSKKIGYQPLFHICNTSGILNYPEAHLDIVRTGIGLYGFGNSEKENKNLKPIAKLKSVISQIHRVEKGQSVGYNRAYKSNAFVKTATIPIGHADGIGRQYGNGKGYVIINDKPAYIIGNVCMDMIMVDITTIDCNEGDEVIVFGNHPHSASEFSKTTQTISYEILTAISQRVKRVLLR
ncbi:alanine racemase [Psychroserpens ponticola]|uniref:Alanine racemase n=1 Tax=Psychroserpens ponticola TaxID=2932268 RepID=A0ABY7RYL4_9FLAO|nr:alanine racemase [Psychroserpens ponticola]WCO01776.1 alanine racemase [Psychroserpens ponticola]